MNLRTPEKYGGPFVSRGTERVTSTSLVSSTSIIKTEKKLFPGEGPSVPTSSDHTGSG